MPPYDPEIHQRRSIRLKGYNYTQSGYYFVTINLNDIRCMLAVWNNGILELTSVGKIVKKYWLEIPEHYPHVKTDEYVIMPDHMHGILIIDNECKGVQLDVSKNISDSSKGVQLNAPTDATEHNQHTPKIDPENKPNLHYANLSPASGSLSVIIRNFKSTVKRWCNQNDYHRFKWQRGFYDRIIRDDNELIRIRRYIRKNPDSLKNGFPGLRG